jgi:DMSO reductase iron-sulfur subunit
MQKAFVLDIDKCTGCQACELACAIENQTDPDVNWRQVTTYNPRRVPGVLSYHLSLACNHCGDPPCLRNCPTLAYDKDPVTGAVTIDAGACIGCRYCSWACPYDAPRFNHRAGVMEKCTFCRHRLEEGLAPACVSACPTGALRIGEHDANERVRVPGFTETDIDPAIRLIAPAREGPSARSHGPLEPLTADAGAPARRARLRTEWSLVLFTLLAAVLVGTFPRASEAGFAGGVVHAAAGFFALLLAGVHLGRRERAWRAVRNWRHSWLSREIILFSSFVALGACSLAMPRRTGWPMWAVTAIGFAALYAVDRVYGVTATRELALHSARAVLTGLLFLGAALVAPAVFVAVAAIKLVLYVRRKAAFRRAGREWRPLASGLRIGVGLVLPALAWFALPGLPALALAALFAGEAVDRCEFYLELDIPSPAAQAAADLRRELRAVADPEVPVSTGTNGIPRA